MTVCIAAICQGVGSTFENPYRLIIGATDRKLTAGDIQFEPPMRKVWQFLPKCVALVAGDVFAQTEICQNILQHRPLSTIDVVKAYVAELCRYNNQNAEIKILAPFGLTMQSFLAQQGSLSIDFVSVLKSSIERERADVETIICGIDSGSPQLYTIDRFARPLCHNTIGFAAIGDGQRHATSEFMFEGYTPYWFVPQALVLAYTAKKHAEVAPGVGAETDVFMIAEQYGGIRDEIFKKLGEEYKRVRQIQTKALAKSYASLEEYLQNLLTATIQTNQQIQPPLGEPPHPRLVDGAG